MNEGDDVCAGCGDYIGHCNWNHHCDEKKIERIERGRKNYSSAGRRPTFQQRLQDGFSMIGVYDALPKRT